jgi:hypothetical protein
MGKLKSIEIIFNDNKLVYCPNDIVSGNIIVETRGDLKINTLKVFIRGVGKVHWTERRTGYRTGNTQHYRSEVEFICLKKTLFDTKSKTTNH